MHNSLDDYYYYYYGVLSQGNYTVVTKEQLVKVFGLPKKKP